MSGPRLRAGGPSRTCPTATIRYLERHYDRIMKIQEARVSTESDIARRAGAGVGMAALGQTLFVPQKVFGANDRVRVAVIGIRGQGFQHIEEYSRLPNVEIAAVCDVDENIIRNRLADMERLDIPKPTVYTDA